MMLSSAAHRMVEVGGGGRRLLLLLSRQPPAAAAAASLAVRSSPSPFAMPAVMPATVGRWQCRTLRSSAASLYALKETRDKEGIEHEVEHHKQDQLKKQKEGQNHWKEELASESESVIKAERSDEMSADEEIEKLQQHTVEKLKPSNESSSRETM